ncbi:MAG: dihydrolipoyl dehydrogenase [Deltaproteobacteria bacterium]|nr:MAG: dihydrolipoyl dehydrogenase [Deltaproteobacteria bacterium]
MSQYDTIILGAGPGGYVAAIRAAQLGAKVCIIEKELVGGTCLNWGCIPTKAMYKSAVLFEQMRNAEAFGLSCDRPLAHLDKIVSRNQQIVAELREGVERLFKKHKVNLIVGTGQVSGPGEIEVVTADGQLQPVRGTQLIIATGSEPLSLDLLPWDDQKVFNTRSILELTRIPQSLFILGGGVSGCEFALLFSALGSTIHMTKRTKEPIKGLDRDINRALIRSLKKRKVKLHLGDPPVSASHTSSGVEITLQSGKRIETEAVLVTVGRAPVSQGIGLNQTGINLHNGYVQVDEHCQTNVPGVYAIGDVTGKKELAHFASHQGIIAVEHGLGNQAAIVDEEAVPVAIFTSPEVASVGLTSQQCDERGIGYLEGSFPFRALGKSHAIGEIDGFVKVIAREKDERIIGIHIIGPDASTLIAECAVTVNQGVTLSKMARTIHAHPTVAEALWEAVEDARGLSIHKMDLGL